MSTGRYSSRADTVFALTDSATIAVDASRGTVARVTLEGNRILGAPINPIDGQSIRFEFKQDPIGGRTLAYDAIYQFTTDLPSPTLTVAANATDFVTFTYRAAQLKWTVLSINLGAAT
jgi:hypothetical protein